MIKAVRTEQDHAEALVRIDQLMSAKRGTAEFGELVRLATLVDAYERGHHHLPTGAIP